MSVVSKKLRYLPALVATALAVSVAAATTANAATNPPTITVPAASAWNGIIAGGIRGTVYEAGTTFTVPHLTCPHNVSGGPSIVGEWIGLGGIGQPGFIGSLLGSPLIQDGIINHCDSHGNQTSYLFWQDLPGHGIGDLFGGFFQAHELSNYPAQPGDVISTSIGYTGGDNFLLAAVDLSTSHGWLWSMTLTDLTELYAVPNTAEWIVETPQVGINRVSRSSLPNFGTIQFDGVEYAPTAGQGGQYVTNSEIHKIVTDYTTGTPETTVTNLTGPPGSSFTVQYMNP
jgi:hypothetical protein